jgi:hypothetical protein
MEFNRHALIGHTGFVGSNLTSQNRFGHLYRSTNIDEIAGNSFDLVVCAGVPAVKWWANKNPEADWENIQKLLRNLERVKARQFLLVSTIDVYPKPNGVAEKDDPAGQENHAYGRHRYAIESFVRERFQDHSIVRLPGLFGPGLKKNVIYDLMHDNCLDAINPASAFQYYDLRRLWGDLQEVLASRIPVVNFATEPIATGEIIDRFFRGKEVGAKAAPLANYDFRTDHAEKLGRGSGPYLQNKNQVLADLGDWLSAEKKVSKQAS